MFIQGQKLEFKCMLKLNKAQKLCDETWNAFSKLLDKYLCKKTTIKRFKI